MAIETLPEPSLPITTPLRPRFGFLTSTPIIAIASICLGLIIALATLLPALLFAVHGRYVTRVVLEPDGRLSVTTFLVWGERTEKLRAENIAARRFWLDRAGDAPLGFETLGVLGFRPCSRGR